MNILAPWWQLNGSTRIRHTDRFWRRVRKTHDPAACWPWTGGRAGCGYGMLRWHGRMVYAHRLAYELVEGPIPPGAVIRHLCDNPLCCRPTHLRRGRQADNMADMARSGRARTRALTHDQVRAIRARLAAGESSSALARAFAVTGTTILRIARRETYRHLEAAA